MIFAGRVRVRYGYSCWGWTRGNGTVWHGGSDEEGLDSALVRMPGFRGAGISGTVRTARRVERATQDPTWEWGWYVCVKLDAGQTPDAVNYLYFCHNAQNLARAGQRVRTGDVLAVMGNTGNAALARPPFAHCHFEVRAQPAGPGLDPTPYTGHANAVGVYGGAPAEGRAVCVTQGPLNVHTGAAAARPIIGQVRPGERYPVADREDGWYFILTKDGGGGWVSGAYVKEA